MNFSPSTNPHSEFQSPPIFLIIWQTFCKGRFKVSKKWSFALIGSSNLAFCTSSNRKASCDFKMFVTKSRVELILGNNRHCWQWHSELLMTDNKMRILLMLYIIFISFLGTTKYHFLFRSCIAMSNHKTIDNCVVAFEISLDSLEFWLHIVVFQLLHFRENLEIANFLTFK